MPQLSLTDIGIQKLQPAEKQVTYFDTNLPNFGIRVSLNTKSFIILYGTSRKMETIGRYPEMSLKDARIRARELLLEKSKLATPFKDKPFPEAVLLFLEGVKGRLKPATLDQYRFYLQTMNFPKAVGEITKDDINEKLSHWDGKPWGQNYAHASMRVFLNWCLDQEYIDKHPLMRGKEPNKTRSRTRVLTDAELAKVWRCTEDNTYGRILRLLLLTGQRRMEVRNLKPEDVADGLITFHTKGDKINVLPVTPLVEENLVLPFKFNNWGDAKEAFDRDCGVEFRHHDLRRTLATKLAGMGIPPVVVERILGHTIPGVAGIYNRHSYLPEIQKALLLYEEHILKIAVLS